MSLTGLAAVALALAHLAGTVAPAASTRLRSFAGGVGAAYVFVIVLPLLSNWQGSVRDRMEADRIVFLVALLGLSAYYALNLWATRLDRADRGNAAVRVHLGGVGFYSIAVGFVLADYGDRSARWLVAYTAVIGLHFYMSARVVPDGERPSLLQRSLLAGAVLLGWAMGKMLPHRLDVAAFLFAAMAGATILDILASELPGRRSGVPGLFLTGVGLIVAVAFGFGV